MYPAGRLLAARDPVSHTHRLTSSQLSGEESGGGVRVDGLYLAGPRPEEASTAFPSPALSFNCGGVQQPAAAAIGRIGQAAARPLAGAARNGSLLDPGDASASGATAAEHGGARGHSR